jgi:RNA polymerase sigma-32 factor
LRKAKSKIGALDEGDMHPDNVTKIASDLGVSETEVVSMNRRLSGGDASLNAMISADGESSMEWQDWLEDEDADQASDYELKDELSLRRDMLNSAMHGLNERERDILTQRRLVDEVQTLEELSETYGISRERVRQIEVRAFEKLQEKMREMALEKGILSE